MLDMYNLSECPYNRHLHKHIGYKGTSHACKNQYNSNDSIYVRTILSFDLRIHHHQFIDIP